MISPTSRFLSQMLFGLTMGWSGGLLASPPALDFRFAPGQEAGWEREQRVEGKPSLKFSPEGLDFTSEGFDLIRREWPVGDLPFELSAEITMRSGRTEQFNRSRGVVITLGTAPAGEASAEDTSLTLAITQTGVVMSAKKGGDRIGKERRPGVWFFPGQELGGAFATSMAGQAGQDFSVRWPTRTFGGTRLRLWASRDTSGNLHFKLYNADGAEGPWWEATIPEALAGANFRWLTIHTGREAADFAQLDKFTLAEGQGNGPADGWITRFQARALEPDGTTKLDVSFPAAVIPSDREHRSRLLTPEQLTALRKKFDSPAFSNYREVVLRTASPEVVAEVRPGLPDQNEALVGLTWSFLLSQDKALLPPLLEQVDSLIGVSDIYPSGQLEFPGRLRQNLFIREFWVQNMAALAVTYDLLGHELGQARRDRIRFVLTRMLQSYHALLDDGDWWFGGNPSNTIGVGNGAVGLIAVVLMEEQPELAQKSLDRAIGNIRKLFVGVDADGGCIEGPMYWNYGLGYPMLLGWALRQTTGSDNQLLTSPQVLNATSYLAVNFGGDGKMIPFNDTQPWLIGWPVLSAAGTEANNPLARWMADHMAAEYAAGSPEPEQARATYSIPAFLYRDTVAAPEKFPGLPNVATLGSVQEGVLRSDGQKFMPTLVTAIKGKGRESTHHANEDQGSFVLYADGTMVLLDPGYFEPTADKHSLPLIGDASKATLQSTTFAPLSDAWEAGLLRSITVDATEAYNTSKKSPPVAERARRVFVQVGDEALVILDDTVPKDPALPITAQYQAGVPVTLDQASATLQGAKGEVVLRLFGPEARLTAHPREFKKDWIYKRTGTPWTTLRSEYLYNSDRPLVTVIQRQPAAVPTVHYAADSISVAFDKTGRVEFKKSPEGWAASQ